jgi:membrane-bound lytic murein transglycosylase B
MWHKASMLTRRVLLSAPLAALPLAARAESRFPSFVESLRAEALHAGISPATVEAAFARVSLNPKILELDRHQPEFTLTWAQYKARVIPPTRIANGRAAYARESSRLSSISATYRCDPRIVVGIWGLESDFGAKTGNYHVVESLANLAYDGRREGYFRSETLNALRILDAGDITPDAMTGSWAGAMGQPQFMPSSYLHYAVDADGDGKRNIWTNRADVFGSIANYLGRSGWRVGEPWVQPVRVPETFAAGATGRDIRKTLGDWQAMGVRRIDGTPFSRTDVTGAVVMPDGAGGEAFMTYPNFHAIRRYNPSDFYALAVGLLGNAVA